MNRRDDASEIVGLDEVSRAYAEAGYDETPPQRLDEAITARAKQRRRGHGARFRLSPGHIAWAAALVLSVSIVLRFGVGPRFDTDGAQTIETAGELSAESDGPEASGRDGSGAGPAPSDAVQSLRSAPRPASAARTPTDDATPRDRAPADDITPQAQSAPAPVARSESAAASSQADRASAERASAADFSAVGCSESDRATAESWLACLGRLRSERDGDPENNRAQTIENELAAFKERYPDRTLPAGLERP